jgi:hypothetical protein
LYTPRGPTINAAVVHCCVALSVAFPALLLHPLQHPCPTRCSCCSDPYRRQVSISAGHYPAGPAGRHPSPSRPAGRTRPSGPGPLYTVHRDHGGHGGHGALDVTGDARPTVTSALLWAARGRAALAGPGGRASSARPLPTCCDCHPRPA